MGFFKLRLARALRFRSSACGGTRIGLRPRGWRQKIQLDKMILYLLPPT